MSKLKKVISPKSKNCICTVTFNVNETQFNRLIEISKKLELDASHLACVFVVDSMNHFDNGSFLGCPVSDNPFK